MLSAKIRIFFELFVKMQKKVVFLHHEMHQLSTTMYHQPFCQQL